MSESITIRYRGRDFIIPRGNGFDPDLADQLIDQPGFELAEAVRRLLEGIKKVEGAGCLDHLDCWDEAGVVWYGAIEFAKAALERYQGKVS
jgi:hypothetical protein